MDEDNAAYLRKASGIALLGGAMSIVGDLPGGFGGALKSGGPTSSGMNTG